MISSNLAYIYGAHVVREALLKKPQVVEKIFLVSEQEESEVFSLAERNKIPISFFNSKTPPRGVDSDVVHQGVIALVNLDKLVIPYGEFIKTLEVNQHTALVLLGEIQDPHNVGSLIRSAVGFGLAGVLVPNHNQAPITGTVAKVSTGMIFELPIVSIGNVNMTLRDLKEKGFWIYGLSEKADKPINKEIFDAPTVFVLGNEAKGIRQKTEELCDFNLAIPLAKKCDSLNVAIAGAIAFYAWNSQHPESLL